MFEFTDEIGARNTLHIPDFDGRGRHDHPRRCRAFGRRRARALRRAGALLVKDTMSATVPALGFEMESGAGGGDRIELLLDVTGGEMVASMAASFGSCARVVFFGEFVTDDTFAAIGFVAPARVELGALGYAARKMPTASLGSRTQRAVPPPGAPSAKSPTRAPRRGSC